jgi:uncharacterized protein
VVNIRFVWTKPRTSPTKRKHGIRFEEAARVFEYPLHVSELKRDIDGEQRWQTFGFMDGDLFVMVANTVNEDFDDGMVVDVIRLITAPRATSKERRDYEV